MDESTREKYQKAGNILAQSLQHGADKIEVGASVLDICDAVEQKIHELNGKIAFPAQLSVNDVAAHACPTIDEATTLKEGDLCKLDIGVHIDGYIADSAITVDLGDHETLVNASQEALNAAIDVVEPGIEVGQIGQAIQDVIEGYDLSPIRNLSGHGLDQYQVHTPPNIPNHGIDADTELERDQVIAIEPFASNGAGIIYEQGNANVYMINEPKPVRNRMARKLLKDIDDRNGLPFTTRWLTRKHDKATVKVGMRELQQKDIIKEYPPLVDEEHGQVAQAEHTIIVQDPPIITTQRHTD